MNGRSCPEQGAALLIAVMITSLVGALAAALVLVMVTESRLGRHQQSAEAGEYGAVAGIERTIGELRRLATWQGVPSSECAPSDCNDGTLLGILADGTRLDLARLTVARQAASNAYYPAGSNRPLWTLHAHASLSRMTSIPGTPGFYVVVWVADDPADTDNDPAHDSNGVVLVHAEAFGPFGAWRAVDATLEGTANRDADGVPVSTRVSVVAWRETR